MNAFDLVSNIDYQTVVAPATIGATTTNSAEVDKKGFSGISFLLANGSLGVGTVKLQHSDVSGSGYVDCGSDDVIGTQEQAFTAGANSKIGYVGSKRYIRAVIVTSVGDVFGVIAVKSSPDVAPVA